MADSTQGSQADGNHRVPVGLICGVDVGGGHFTPPNRGNSSSFTNKTRCIWHHFKHLYYFASLERTFERLNHVSPLKNRFKGGCLSFQKNGDEEPRYINTQTVFHPIHPPHNPDSFLRNQERCTRCVTSCSSSVFNSFQTINYRRKRHRLGSTCFSEPMALVPSQHPTSRIYVIR